MPRTKNLYPADFRDQIVALHRAGRSIGELAKEFEPNDAPGEGVDFAALECELLDLRKFRTKAEARVAVFEFIEGWYNPRRRHSAIGYLSPLQYERRQQLPPARPSP